VQLDAPNPVIFALLAAELNVAEAGGPSIASKASCKPSSCFSMTTKGTGLRSGLLDSHDCG
jgi:hypothetical protein